MKRGVRKFSHIQDEEFAESASSAAGSSESCCAKCMPDENGPGYIPGIIAIILVLLATIGVILAAVLPGALHKPEPPGPAPTPSLPCNTTWPFPIEPVKWTDCPVFTNPSDSARDIIFAPQTIQALDNHFDIPFGASPVLKAQCATIRVPMDWDNSTSGWCFSISLFVKSIYLDNIPQRLFSPSQLWWFPGGTEPSSALESSAAGLVKASNGSVEIYLTDRRGTGKSDFFDCPAALSDFGGCLTWAEEPMRQIRIKSQTITNSALDIVHAMNSVELGAKQRRVIMGTSQSSYYIQRFLRVAPEDFVDGAILDSVLPSDVTKLPQAEAVSNYVGLDILTRCAQDSDCASHFADKNPVRTMYNIRLDYDNPDQTSCLMKLGLTPGEFSSRLASMMYQSAAMSLIPAVIARVSRCSDADLAALKNNWIKATAPHSLEGRPGNSILTELANDWSELWFVPGSAVESARAVASNGCGWMQGVADSALFGSPLRPFSADGCARKERAKGALSYNSDTHWLKYPNTQVPILLMNGEFDSVIPMSWVRHAAAKLKRAGSNSITLVEIPYAGHVPTSNSPTLYGGHCGMDLAFSFAISTASKPTTACVAQVLPFNFSNGTSETNAALLGTQDIWG